MASDNKRWDWASKAAALTPLTHGCPRSVARRSGNGKSKHRCHQRYRRRCADNVTGIPTISSPKNGTPWPGASPRFNPSLSFWRVPAAPPPRSLWHASFWIWSGNQRALPLPELQASLMNLASDALSKFDGAQVIGKGHDGLKPLSNLSGSCSRRVGDGRETAPCVGRNTIAAWLESRFSRIVMKADHGLLTFSRNIPRFLAVLDHFLQEHFQRHGQTTPSNFPLLARRFRVDGRSLGSATNHCLVRYAGKLLQGRRS
jgi:hypothetical protein